MGFHPLNLTLRFILELVGLVGVFRLGLETASGGVRWVIAVVLTVGAMIVWANFRVPGDTSAKGNAPFPVSGPVRLVIEVLVFGAGAVGWFVSGPAWMAWTFLGSVVAHHILSYDRIGWLLTVSADGEPPFEDDETGRE